MTDPTCCNKPMRTHYGDGLPRPEPWCSVCGRKGLPPDDSGNWVDLATGEPIYSRTTKSNDMRPLTNPVFTINRASDDGLAGFTDDPKPCITLADVVSFDDSRFMLNPAMDKWRTPNGRCIELKLDTVKAPADNHVFISAPHTEQRPRAADYDKFFEELNKSVREFFLRNLDLADAKDK